jgi:hypothetical protein
MTVKIQVYCILGPHKVEETVTVTIENVTSTRGRPLYSD